MALKTWHTKRKNPLLLDIWHKCTGSNGLKPNPKSFIPYNSFSNSLLMSNKLYKAVNIIIMFAMDVKHYIYNWHIYHLFFFKLKWRLVYLLVVYSLYWKGPELHLQQKMSNVIDCLLVRAISIQLKIKHEYSMYLTMLNGRNIVRAYHKCLRSRPCNTNIQMQNLKTTIIG